MELLVLAAEFVLVLDATDSFLTDRVINLPEETVQDLGYEPEKFLSRLAIYRDNTQEEKSVLNYFEELDISPVLLGNMMEDNFLCRDARSYIYICIGSDTEQNSWSGIGDNEPHS